MSILPQLIVAIALLIIVHEGGHFLVARLLGVEIEEFGIGFPPRIGKIFRAWDTDFTLNWLPLGGFVRPKGENDPELPGGLAAAAPWKRILILLAGPTMNLLVGIILYTTIFARFGMPDPTRVQIWEIAPDSPAEQAGLLPGDMVFQVDQTPIHSTQELIDTINAHLDKPTEIHFYRSQEENTLTVVPRSHPPKGEGAIGISIGNPGTPIAWYRAIPAGTTATFEHVTQIVLLPLSLMDGGRLVGYFGIFQLYKHARSQDANPSTPTPPGVNQLAFFVSITLSLAVLNMLPVPALDGGRILFTLPEIFLHRRIPPAIENTINLIGFGLLIWALLYINIQDFVNPILIP